MKIAIIGSGFTGVCTAFEIFEKYKDDLKLSISIFEKDADLKFRGIAYQNKAIRDDRLNVRANAMGISKDYESEFYDWLNAKLPNKYKPSDFVPRHFYGDYLNHKINSLPKDRVQFILDEVIDIQIEKSLVLKSGKLEKFDKVFLCTGIFPRKVSPIENDFLNENQIVIKGTGLSAVDQIIELHKKHFSGEIICYSRHALLPLVHEEKPLPAEHFKEFQLTGCLLQDFRLIKDYFKSNQQSQGLINHLRPTLSFVWSKYSLREKKQFQKYLKTYWDIIRHRMSQEHAHTIQKLIQEKRLNLVKISEFKTKLFSDLRTINCTGFEGLKNQLLFENLIEKGIIKTDPLGWGIETSSHHIVDDWLFALGGLRRFEKFELSAVKEIREDINQLINSFN